MICAHLNWAGGCEAERTPATQLASASTPGRHRTPVKPSSGGAVAGKSQYVPILTQSMPGGLVATHTAQGLSHLTLRFSDFVEFCYHAGMVAYSKPVYAGMYPTLLEKYQALFRCLQVTKWAPGQER